MHDLLLQSGLAVFAVALLIIVVRLLAIEGWKFKFLVSLAVFAAAIVMLNGIIQQDPQNNLISQSGSVQPGSAEDYLARSQRAYSDGVAAFNNKEYLKSAEYLEQVVPDDPNYRDARAKIGMARQKYADGLLAEAGIKMQAGDYERANQLIDQALLYQADSTAAKKLKQQLTAKVEALLSRRAAEKAARELALAKTRMDKWDFGSGPLGLAVRQTKFTTTVATTYGFFYDSRGSSDLAYLWLQVSAFNGGSSQVWVDPNDFTLSTAQGYMASRNESTFSQEYFHAVDLAPRKTNAGWIIFFVPKEAAYTLHYYGAAGNVEKQIVL